MESTIAIDNAYSWRDILLTFALASAVIVFFFRQRSTPSSSSAAVTPSISEEERRRRREHIAAIAEERAKAKRLQELQDANSDISKVEVKDTTASAQTQSGDKYSVHESRASSEPQSEVNYIQTQNTTNEDEGRITNPDDHNFVNENNAKNNEKDEEKESAANNEAAADDVSIEGGAAAAEAHGNGEETTNSSAELDSVAGYAGGVSEGEASDGKQSVDAHVGNITCDGKVNDESTEGDNVQNAGGEGGADHRERHANAIANIMAKKGKQDDVAPASTIANVIAKKGKQDDAAPTVSSLKIYLILTSSPGSSKLELSIPTNSSCAVLLRSVSQVSGVPADRLKLIFRGRIITESSTKGHVVDEYGIENESVLHVVGKPHQPKETYSDSRSEEEDISDSEEEEDDDDRARDQAEHAIRMSSGDGMYHIAAQMGDLAFLREAVDTGLERYLHLGDSNGWTVLHEAVRAGHVDVVEYLAREVGLNVNEATNLGGTPLSLAIEHHGTGHPITIMLQNLLILDGVPSNPWANDEEDGMYD